MLAIFVCQCANGELKARKVLKSAEITGYLSVKCYTGKKHAEIGLDNMPESIKQTAEFGALREKIKQATGYAIIAGWDNKNLRWSDVYDGRLESVVPGEQIAEHFALIK